MQKLKKLFLIIVMGLVIVNPVLVVAQTKSTAINVTEYKGVDSSLTSYLCTPDPTGTDSHALENCVNKLYRFGIAFGSIALVFFLVFAGYMYITGGESGKTKAKGILENAFIGMALLVGSYVILSFINPSLVIFKPIQPPIFNAADLPSCEEVGLGQSCTIQDGSDSTSNVGTGWGADMTCPSGQLVSAKGLGLPTKQGDEQICKPFGEKLVALKTSLAGISWRITDTIGPGHVDPCHSSGSPVSGTCADIGLEPSDRSDANWDKLCKSILAISNLQPVNEVIGAGTRLPNCPKEADYKRTGSNVHVNWKVGTGKGGSGGGTTSGGTRPDCTAVSGVPGVCANPIGSGTYPSTWDNTKPELKTAFLALKKKYPKIVEGQIYRPAGYSAYLRSIFEAYQLAVNKWTDAEIKSFGQYCGSTGIQYVTAENAKDPKVKAWAIANASHFGSFANPTSPTTCKSDHSQGIALDIDGYSATKAFEDAARAVGLCHDVPIFTAHGVKSKPDVRHFALINSPGVVCTNYW